MTQYYRNIFPKILVGSQQLVCLVDGVIKMELGGIHQIIIHPFFHFVQLKFSGSQHAGAYPGC